MSTAGPSRLRSPAPAASFPSFSRAMSPALMGTAIKSGASSAHERVAASALAKSWTDVLDCVPSAYKEALREPLKDLHSRAVKFHASEAAYEKLCAGQNDAKVPPQVQGLHEPVWQVAKEFKASEAGGHMLTDIQAAHETYRSSVWEAGLELKKAELAFHKNRLTTGEWWPAIEVVANDVFSKMDRLAPVVIPGSEGQEVTVTYNESSTLALEHKQLLQILPDLCLRIIALEKAKVLAEANKLRKKAELKEAADVEMADGTGTDSKEMRALVIAEVRKELAKHPQASKGTAPSKASKKAPKAFVRKHKGKTGHTDPKTGLAAPLHYGPAQKKRNQGGKNNAKGKQPGSSKQSK
ncbi:hypothetical protein RSOLAG1IB_10512 [Rhizoctonia solani AG-1 IB]|uniref:Uncharacterized protein n=1 Tax=Thanatephorus cucumeris (strain AG1-IB / isolate 7/3/14) TaxID=1108050 RepID=M5BWB8_THACB|nr:hypothetical protein BN14_06005 [Rhizoctonia solani AG-1 IB]CEL62836.1 hypothetical protein RSOLAG1IB_10512 [Rhizoctonia solani AG-1 IB]